MHGLLQTKKINYWRDKSGHEIDFVYTNKSDNSMTAIECKFSSAISGAVASALVSSVQAFRKAYPQGENYVVASDIDIPFKRHYGETVISFVNTHELIKNLRAC